MPQLRDIPRRPAFPSSRPNMAVPPRQQPMPPGGPHPQPHPALLAALMGNQETFGESISGPVITVQVGPQSFTLPMKLLARNSAFFRNEIMSLGSVTNKKRKRTPEHEDGVEAAVKVEEKDTEGEKSDEDQRTKRPAGAEDVNMTNTGERKEQDLPKATDSTINTAQRDAAATLLSIKEEEKLQEPETEPKPESHRPSLNTKVLYINCSDIDPFIFGLFLKFIYTGFYAVQIDAQHYNTMAAMPMPAHPSSVPHPGPPPTSPYSHPAPQPVPFEQASHEEKARRLLHMIMAQKDTPNPTAAPLPPPPPTPKPKAIETFVPPSIHAYLLAHRLGSPAFMNHTIHHIYHAIGRDFPLTPWLVDWVWKKTAAFYPGSSSKKQNDNPTSAASTTTPSPTPTWTNSGSSATGANGVGNGTGIPPTSLFPLRKLILDILIHHWPSQATHIIARNQGMAWNRVFDLHGELRHEVMMGLQGGVKVRAVEGYYVRVRM